MSTCKPELCGLYAKKGNTCPFLINGSCYTQEEIESDLFLYVSTIK